MEDKDSSMITGDENEPSNSPLIAKVKNSSSDGKMIFIGHGWQGKSLAMETLVREHDGEVEFITVEEAESRGYKGSELEIINQPTMKITASTMMGELVNINGYKSGQDKRREKREKERRDKKCK